MEIVLLPENMESVTGEFSRDGESVHLSLQGHRHLVDQIREILTMHLILPAGGNNAAK